jgi:outer membrane protein assembly factor BamA
MLNVNISNYFNVYQSSYNSLNNLAQTYNTNPNYVDASNNLIIPLGTNGFLNDVLGETPTIFPNDNDFKTIRSIDERKQRLTENNLIFASNFTFTKTTKKDLYDNTFYAVKTKVESAGNFLSLLARASKQLSNQEGANTIFDVEFSQYLKGEIEYIKHWDLTHKKVFAVRSFFGLAVPYGNSNNIPFSRSYFGGGSNDNRAWQSYGLGPGKTSAVNDFNEANMKIALNAELRFNIFQQLNGAVFTDVGNIWNVLDNVDNQDAIFKGFNSVKELAVGTGFGLRYDFNFFVIRLDLGFKTYNPALEENNKWFKEFRLSKSVLNIGINYPF